MNTYKKWCPNVFVAKCEQEYKKGDVITLETRRGKQNEHIVHNFLGELDGYFYYSITREDGFNSQARAANKIERLESWAESAEKRSQEWYEKSNEGAAFLSLGEPIKIGHHSERRHRNLIDRNWQRMGNSVAESKKAEAHRSKISYWESMAEKIDLSMPESLGYFEHKLKEAELKHAGIKDGSIPREHSYSLTYAKKEVNDLKKKLKTAERLWG